MPHPGHATVSDLDGGTLSTRFIMWPTGSPSGNVFGKACPGLARGKTATAIVPNSTLKDGTSYSWQVNFTDGRKTTPFTPGDPPCWFIVDNSAPAKPGTISAQFLNGDDGRLGAPAGTEGTYPLSNSRDSGITKYLYELNARTPTTVATPTSPGASASVKLRPTYAEPQDCSVALGRRSPEPWETSADSNRTPAWDLARVPPYRWIRKGGAAR